MRNSNFEIYGSIPFPSCETYADEKVESVSQKMRGKSKTEQIKRREEMEAQLKEAEVYS